MTQELHNRSWQVAEAPPFAISPATDGSIYTEDPDQPEAKPKTKLATLGEEVADAYLQQAGCRILHRNWRAGRRGEVDLIAVDPCGLLIFIEVKSRLIHKLEPGFDWPGFDAVHRKKQRQLIYLARTYMAQRGTLNSPCRFDVMVIWFMADKPGLEPFNEQPQIFHVPDAFAL